MAVCKVCSNESEGRQDSRSSRPPAARRPQHPDEPLNGVTELVKARTQPVAANRRQVTADIGQ